MVEENTSAWAALVEGFGLNRDQRGLIIRVLWVIYVNFHMAWVCGFLAPFGMASPFARASDFEQLKQATITSARLQIIREVREQTSVMCSIPSGAGRETITTAIDRLRDEYWRITGQGLPPPNCEK